MPEVERVPAVRRLLARDRELTRSGRLPTLFSYFIARPRKDALDDTARLAAWQAEEDERERRAAARGGVYSTRQYLRLRGEQAGRDLLQIRDRWSTRLRDLRRWLLV